MLNFTIQPHYFWWFVHSEVAQMVKNLPARQRWGFNQEDLMKDETATHTSILAWRGSWAEEPGRYSPWDCKESDTTERLIPCSRWMCLFSRLSRFFFPQIPIQYPLLLFSSKTKDSIFLFRISFLEFSSTLLVFCLFVCFYFPLLSSWHFVRKGHL